MGVVCTPAICSGAPRVDGTRITVYNVVSKLRRESLVDFLASFPQIEEAEVLAVIDYCRRRECEVDQPEHYCDGCSLRRKYDGESFEEFLEAAGGVQTTDEGWGDLDGPKFLGSLEELRSQFEGEDGWEIAQSVYERLRLGPAKDGR